MIKPLQPGFAGGKQANHAFGVSEMHPYPRFAGLPPEREVLATLMFEMLMSLEAQRRSNLPLRGRCRRQKGCISDGPKARLYGFRCLRQRCRQRRHIYCGASRHHHPLNPLNPLNLLNLLNPFPAPYYTTRRREAVPTCGASRTPFFNLRRQPLLSQTTRYPFG